MSSRPNSNTANRPTRPAPMISTSVLIVSLIDIVPAAAGSPLWLFVWSRRLAGHLRIRNSDQAQQFRQILLWRLVGGRERDIRICVERLAAFQDGDEILHGAHAVGDRPHVALCHDAL